MTLYALQTEQQESVSTEDQLCSTQEENAELKAHCDTYKAQIEEQKSLVADLARKLEEGQEKNKLMAEEMNKSKTSQWQAHEINARHTEELRSARLTLKRMKSELELEQEARERVQQNAVLVFIQPSVAI